MWATCKESLTENNVCVLRQRAAFMTSALILGAVFFLCCMVLFLGVREQSGECAIYSIEVFHSSHIDNGMQVILSCGPVNQPDLLLNVFEGGFSLLH